MNLEMQGPVVLVIFHKQIKFQRNIHFALIEKLNQFILILLSFTYAKAV